jgi:hypothetical protein
MKRFALVLLLSMVLAGCDDGDNGGGGQSYTVPPTQPTQPTPMPYGEPFVVDEREEDRWIMGMWDAVMQADEAIERRDAIR